MNCSFMCFFSLQFVSFTDADLLFEEKMRIYDEFVSQLYWTEKEMSWKMEMEDFFARNKMCEFMSEISWIGSVRLENE